MMLFVYYVIVPSSHTLHTESTLGFTGFSTTHFSPAHHTNKSRIRRLPIIVNLLKFVALSSSSVRCLCYHRAYLLPAAPRIPWFPHHIFSAPHKLNYPTVINLFIISCSIFDLCIVASIVAVTISHYNMIPLQLQQIISRSEIYFVPEPKFFNFSFQSIFLSKKIFANVYDE